MQDSMGVEQTIDWLRTRHLFKLGLVAALMVTLSDFLLAYGEADPTLSGLEGALSAYVGLSDTRLFWSALLGLIGIPIEGLCYFAIYRLMAATAPKHAHAYRAGVLGYLVFGACGVHVPCLAVAYVYKTFYAVDPALALDVCLHFGLYFMAPAFVLFFIAFFTMTAVQIHAFAKGLTPYPRWCWVFSLAFFAVVGVVTALLPSTAIVNAIGGAWVSIANIWMFAGLLAAAPKAQPCDECPSKLDNKN